MYVLFTKRIETFWFGDFRNTRDIRTYCFQVYILIQIYQNQKRKKLNYSQRPFELYQVSQRFQYCQIVYTKSITQ